MASSSTKPAQNGPDPTIVSIPTTMLAWQWGKPEKRVHALCEDSPFLASSSRARFLAASASKACASRASLRFSRIKSACSLLSSLIFLLARAQASCASHQSLGVSFTTDRLS